MSADLDVTPSPPSVGHVVYAPHDLEVITIAVQIAALSLTSNPGDTFTLDEIIAEAKRYVGNGLFDDEDVVNVLPGMEYIECVSGVRYRMR